MVLISNSSPSYLKYLFASVTKCNSAVPPSLPIIIPALLVPLSNVTEPICKNESVVFFSNLICSEPLGPNKICVGLPPTNVNPAFVLLS